MPDLDTIIAMSCSSDHVNIQRWTANAKRQAIRIHVTCAGTMCIIYLHRGNDLAPKQKERTSFCMKLYDSVQRPYFQFETRSRQSLGKTISVEEDDTWLRPLKGPECYPAKDHNSSNELFDLIRAQLPGSLQAGSTNGMFCYCTIDDDPEHPGQGAINLRSDIFRQYLLEDLRVLKPEIFPNIERIDLSRIRIHNFFRATPQVIKVGMVQADGDSTEELILKIGVLPDYEGPARLPERIEESKGHQQRHFQELSDWSKVWGHENIMSPPKYLVTVPDGDCVKLVGWLQVVFRDWSNKLRRPHRNKGDHTTAHKLLGYVTDLARGMLHMTKKGYIHPDVQWHNCLFDGPENDDHLVIFDFEPFSDGPGVYLNPTGPRSSEVCGHWDVSHDAKGDLVYSRIDPPGRGRMFTILTDWADFPEALERLQVFCFACVAADMLTYRSPNRDNWPGYYLNLDEPESLKKARGKWEESLPAAAKTLLEECWSFDPRHRPLFVDILRRLTGIRSAMDAPTSTNVSQDQSKDIESSG